MSRPMIEPPADELRGGSTPAPGSAQPADILLQPTPRAWVDAAQARWRELLLDHLGCEKKAASTAVSLIFAYPEDHGLATALSKLAREELRHFEQVQGLMAQLDVAHERQRPGRYGGGLRAAIATGEPARKLDLLLIGALIEARSAERFVLLGPRLPAPLGPFYNALAQSEARHHKLYLRLAGTVAHRNGLDLTQRLLELARVEAELATAPDPQFRFHSGTPS